MSLIHLVMFHLFMYLFWRETDKLRDEGGDTEREGERHLQYCFTAQEAFALQMGTGSLNMGLCAL